MVTGYHLCTGVQRYVLPFRWACSLHGEDSGHMSFPPFTQYHNRDTHTHHQAYPPPSSTGGFSTSFFVFCDVHFLGGTSAKISSPAELLAVEDPDTARYLREVCQKDCLLSLSSCHWKVCWWINCRLLSSRAAAVVFLAGVGFMWFGRGGCFGRWGITSNYQLSDPHSKYL